MRRDRQFLGVECPQQHAWAKGQAVDVSAGVATRPDENRPPHPHNSPPCADGADIAVANSPRNVVTNAASTGIRIDRKRLKSLARRSDAPGLTYLVVWVVAMGATGALVWLALGTLYVWPAMFAYGVVMSVPAYSLSHETAHGTAFRTRWLNETVFWFTSLLYGEEPLASALHAHQPPHPHLVRRTRQPDALRHAARLQGLALRHQRPVAAQVPAPGPVAARDRTLHDADAGGLARKRSCRR